MLLTLKSLINKSFTLLLFLGLLFSSSVQAQLTERTVWDGPFDIKMIAAPNLIPVFVNPAGAAGGTLLADSFITDNMILRTEGIMNINNDYKGGSSTPTSPFQKYALPPSAWLCGDPSVPCYAGLTTTTPTTTCPVKYNSPVMSSKMYVSMTYADVDGDVSTYSSSMAQLDISSCSEIEAAYLYWAGMFQGSNDALTLVDGNTNSYSAGASGKAGNAVFNVAAGSGYNTVKFKIPGGAYQTITADAVISPASTTNKYVCVKNVTSILQGTGGGQFWVGNLQSYPIESGGGSSSGWTLVVVFRSPLSPPRRISLWDGLQGISSSETFSLTGLQTPSTANFKSYVGFASLDAEDVAEELGGSTPIGMGFKTNNGSTVQINPFLDQPTYKLYNNKGYPMDCNDNDLLDSDGCKVPQFNSSWCSVYDGIASSHITTYDQTTNKNGYEMVRLPTNKNTLGFDAHNILLPPGAVTAGATSASITLSVGGSGSFDVFMAYIAIERLQPKLVMTKLADKSSTTAGSTITYTLRIKNLGNTASLGNDLVFDSLDAATDYVAGSLTSKRYVSSVVTTPAPGVTLVSSANDSLQFKLANAILPNDSVDIIFTVNVKPVSSNLFSAPFCIRTIENTGWVKYGTATAGNLLSKSNANDCGIGTETRVLLTGFTNPTTVLGPFNACPYITETVIPHVQSALTAAGISAAILDEFDIRTAPPANARVQTADVFSSASSSMSYFAYRDVVSGGNCQQIYEIKYTSCNLPVTLVSFTGSKENSFNMLSWITASEKDNDYFVVETSVNGKDFVSLGTVQGNGNSSTSHVYVFTAEHPSNGINYYRLKQVDFNGSVTYSHTIAIDNKEVDMDIYPNPNQGAFTIRFIAPGESYKLDVTDVLGKTVYSISGHTVPESVEVNDLAKGVYLVRFYLENKAVIKKMMVY